MTRIPDIPLYAFKSMEGHETFAFPKHQLEGLFGTNELDNCPAVLKVTSSDFQLANSFQLEPQSPLMYTFKLSVYPEE